VVFACPNLGKRQNKTGASPGAGYIRNPQNVISVVNSLQMKKF